MARRYSINQMLAKLNKVRIFWLISTIFLLTGLFVLFIELMKSPEPPDAPALPCPYSDSMNISGGEHLSHGSIKFNNIIYPKDLYAEVNVLQRHDADGKPFYEKVEPYIRGCTCNITACMFICYTGDGTENCKTNISSEPIEKVLNEEFESEFLYKNEKPCTKSIIDDDFEITNGTIWNCFSDYDCEEECEVNCTEMHSRDLFISYNVTSNEKSFYICDHKLVNDTAEKTYLHFKILPYFMFTSVAFIIATFFVYICIPELRNLHGKCLLCYLLSLAIAFSLMGWLYINTSKIHPTLCQFIGYFTYFVFQLAFFWLNVICFDLWWNFRRTSGFIISERKRFMIYSLYTWGAALFLTLFIFILDRIKSIPKNLRPGVAVEMCFLGTSFPQMFMYFYLPLLILCCLNITFFAFTAVTIRQLQIQMKKIVSQDESRKYRRKLDKDKANRALFLRLFIVMGVGWIMEVMSYIIGPEGIYFILFDIWNCSAGILIFICMVVKRRVFILMKKRWSGVYSRSVYSEDPATYSSTVTGEPMQMQRLTSHISAAREAVY